MLGEYVRPLPGERVLDIGCGPAQILELLPDSCPYIGFDSSVLYINSAKKRWGGRGQFFHATVDAAALEAMEPVHIVLATGVLHHLNDEEALQLFALARRVLIPGGRFVTFDGAFVQGQPTVARWLLKMDRGCHVREAGDYLRLARVSFPAAEVHVRHDLLHVPYTHAIITAEAVC